MLQDAIESSRRDVVTGLAGNGHEPAFLPCLNCRCDPRCLTTDHPSSSSILTMSRIFTTRRNPATVAARRRPTDCHVPPSATLSHDARLRSNLRSPAMAMSAPPSPKGWSQNWAHEFPDAANRSGISTFRTLPSMPWAQGVAGSNPVAPTKSSHRLHKSYVDRDFSPGVRLRASCRQSPLATAFRSGAATKAAIPKSRLTVATHRASRRCAVASGHTWRLSAFPRKQFSHPTSPALTNPYGGLQTRPHFRRKVQP